MQKYLHMSKKSCTFAVDLGIVPTVTIKYNRVMTKECIFRVDGGKGIYRVCQKTTVGGYILFTVYKGRKLALPISVYEKASEAIQAANNAAYQDCKDIHKLIYTL